MLKPAGNLDSSMEHRVVAIVVDDDEVFRIRLCRALRERHWDAHDASDSEAGLRLTRELSPDLVLLDLKMPGAGGLETIERIKALDSTICIIMLTGYGSIATALQALRLGADHYLSKPMDADQILAAYSELQGRSLSPAEHPTVPSLARVEWEHIQRVLADCSGNVSHAAKLLGLHRRSLQRKLSKYPPRQ
jgi:two-component system response regulator RegA